MKKILIVDDEVQILKAITRMFLDTEYEILTAETGSEALNVLESSEIDMMISDMKMPLMDGCELLLKVKELYPRIIRISLSGYTEESSMLKAYLHNIATLHIFKPWNNNEMLQNIEKLFATDLILSSPELVKQINDNKTIPLIPENCQQMIELIDNEDIDALISEIEKDPELSALLLKAAKSAIFGATPGSVRQAAVYIGLENLKCFIYWAAMTDKDNWPEWAEDEMAVLWKQACCTNNLLLFLYEAFLHKQPPEGALFAGLLHNVGFPILYKSYMEKYNRQLGRTEFELQELLSLELEESLVTHQKIGGYIMNLWDLSFPAVEVALYHHRPLDPNIVNVELVSCVHIAQHYAWKVISADATIELLPEVFDRIGVAAKDFEERLARYLKKGICA